MNPVLFMLVAFSVTLNALAQIALRKTMLTIGTVPSVLVDVPPFLLTLLKNFWFLGGMSCYVVSLGTWMAVLRKLEVSIAYPLLSIGYFITALIGYFFMSEHVNTTRVLGIIIISIGIIVVSRSS